MRHQWAPVFLAQDPLDVTLCERVALDLVAIGLGQLVCDEEREDAGFQPVALSAARTDHVRTTLVQTSTTAHRADQRGSELSNRKNLHRRELYLRCSRVAHRRDAAREHPAEHRF